MLNTFNMVSSKLGGSTQPWLPEPGMVDSGQAQQAAGGQHFGSKAGKAKTSRSEEGETDISLVIKKQFI